MRILIVDDEPLARARLKHMVNELAVGEVVGDAQNGTEAVKKTALLNPDVVLMDIRMPGMDGMEAAGHISSMDEAPAIIFTTAYDDHALQAFEVHAVAYLLKPVQKEKLAQALHAACRLNKVQLAGIEQNDEQTDSNGRTHISARVRGSLQLIPVAEIRFFQADQKYVRAVYDEGELLIEDSLKSLEEEFGERFVRIHRNALVATGYISALHNKDGQLLIELSGTDERLEVSRRHSAEIRKLLKQL